MSQPNPQDPSPASAPGTQPAPAAPAPAAQPPADPTPAPPGTGDEHGELRATLNQLHDENEQLRLEMQGMRSVFGRMRRELELPKESTGEEAFAEALQGIRKLKKLPDPSPGSAPSSSGEPAPAGTVTEEQLNAELTKARERWQEEQADQIAAAHRERDQAITKWKQDRIDTHVVRACQEMSLSPTLVLALLRDARSAYDWTLQADESGGGVKVCKRGDSTGAPYYSKEKTKYLDLSDALAIVAADNPGVSMVAPKPGTGAGVNSEHGPAPFARKDPASMSPEEKVRGAF